MTSQATYKGLSFTDKDIANPDNFIPAGESNPHNVHPILIHGEYGVLGVAFAEHMQDALDILADAGKLACCAIDYEDEDYDADAGTYNGQEVDYLGNYCHPFDLGDVRAIDLPNPAFSFVALFNAIGKEVPT